MVIHFGVDYAYALMTDLVAFYILPAQLHESRATRVVYHAADPACRSNPAFSYRNRHTAPVLLRWDLFTPPRLPAAGFASTKRCRIPSDGRLPSPNVAP